MSDFLKLGSGEPEGGSNAVGDAPSFSVAGFLSPDPGTSGDTSGGSGGTDSGGFDPAIHVGPDKRNADGSYTRKRGPRRAGNTSSSGNRKPANLQASVDALSGILVVLHSGIAAATKTPEIAIDADDAGTLAKATANVLAEFNIAPDPKIAAVIGLVIAAGSVYGPMAVSIRLRKQQEAKDRASQYGQQ